MTKINHPTPLRPEEHANWSNEKMGKGTIYRSDHVMVGLNAFEAGQEHKLHAHADMDKIYHVVQGEGLFLLEDREEPMAEGTMLIAPAGIAHGIRNNSKDRLLVLAILTPAPQH